MQSMLHVRIDPLDQMENLRQFFVDPRIDKPWGEYSKGKATRTVCLRYTNQGAKERQQPHPSSIATRQWRQEQVEPWHSQIQPRLDLNWGKIDGFRRTSDTRFVPEVHSHEGSYVSVDAPQRPNLCTASAWIVVAFPLEYSPKVYQSVDRQRTT